MIKRNKITSLRSIIILPFVVFTLIIGWFLSATGEKTNRATDTKQQ